MRLFLWSNYWMAELVVLVAWVVRLRKLVLFFIFKLLVVYGKQSFREVADVGGGYNLNITRGSVAVLFPPTQRGLPP